MRKIKILSTRGTNVTIETNVTTLGQLKPLLEDNNVDVSGMSMLLGETRTQVSLDSALLPTTDFKMFLMPAKTKSGNDAASICSQISSLFADLAVALNNGGNCDAVSYPVQMEKEDPDMEELRALEAERNGEDDDSWIY